MNGIIYFDVELRKYLSNNTIFVDFTCRIATLLGIEIGESVEVP